MGSTTKVLMKEGDELFRQGDEGDSAVSCCLLTASTNQPRVGGAQMVIPWGALIDASPDQTLTL